MVNYNKFQEELARVKLRLMRMHYESKVGHIGGNLSVLDALLFTHHYIIQDGDQCVLSKGHAAGALYVTLWSIGKLSEEDLCQFHQDGTKISGHPIGGWNDNIPFSTGSLGHGLSLAAGLALAKKLRNEAGRVFCFMSDGEWEEGSNWEALIFIAHHKLDNLVVLIDGNGIQGFGSTNEVASLEPLHEKIAAFGVKVDEVDGHNPQSLASAFSYVGEGSPSFLLLRTVKGNSVSFMEGKMEWHYLPLKEEQYHQAKEELTV